MEIKKDYNVTYIKNGQIFKVIIKALNEDIVFNKINSINGNIITITENIIIK